MRIRVERKPTVEDMLRLLTSHGKSGLFILKVHNGIVLESAPLETDRSREWQDWLKQALTNQSVTIGD